MRMAGYMVPQQAGIASVDGGNTAAADLLCLSDPSKIMDDTEVAATNATERFGPASRSAVGGCATDGDASVATWRASTSTSDGEQRLRPRRGPSSSSDGTEHPLRASSTSMGGGSDHVDHLRAGHAGSAFAIAVSTATGRAVPAIAYRVER